MISSTDEKSSLSDEQADALQEVVNIGMGIAGDSLARILRTFVKLSIPRIRLIHADNVNLEIAKLIGEDTMITGVRQAFFSYWRGEAISVYDQNGCSGMATLMGYPNNSSNNADADADAELLLDVGNVLVGACINGIAKQLNVEVNFGPPSVIASNVPADALFNTEKLSWSHSLLLEVNFNLEALNFKSHLLVMMSEETISILKSDLDQFLEAI